MDRIAFKQRMQNLKSYRENNPGKGYWDWKIQSFAEGGENSEEVNDSPFVGPITEKQMLDQNKQMAKEIMRNQFLRNEGRKAKANPDFANYMYDFDFDRLNHEDPNERKYTLLNYWKRAREVRDEEIGKYTTPYIPEKEVMLTTGRFNTGRISTNVLDSLLASSKRTGYSFEDALGLAARESGLGYARWHKAKGKLSNTALLSNWNQVQTVYNTNSMVDKFKSIYNKYINEQPITDKELDFIKLYIDNEDKQYDSTRPITENVWDNALKTFESGNYNHADPTYMNKVRMEGRMLMQDPAIKRWAKTAKFAEGGEVGDEDKQQQITNAITYALNRGNIDAAKSLMSRGTPNTDFYYPQSGAIDPVFSLYDTPVLGDAMVATDATKYALDGDWANAGLAMAGLIIPGAIGKGIKKGKKIVRSIPEVTKDRQTAINNVLERIDKANQTKADYTNEQYKIIENVMEDPSYIRRAEEVKKQFGDDYTIPYADMFTAYNIDPSSLPQVDIIDDFTKAGSMRRTEDGNFIYERNPKVNAPNVATHELSHLADLLKSGRTNAEAGNNMFYKMTQDLTKKLGDKRDTYFSNPSEQKAHMNQLRSWLFDNGYINTRDQKITPEYMAKMLSKIDNVEGMEGVRRAAKQFKSVKTYTKWFNSIPLLGAGAIGANAYFKRNKDEQRTDTKKI